MQDFKLVNRLDHPNEVLCCAYTPDKRYLLTGTTDGLVRKFRSGSIEILQTYVDDDVRKEASPVTAIRVRGKLRHFLAGYAAGCVKIWDLESAKCIRTIFEDQQTLGLAVHPMDAKFLTMGDNAVLTLYDEETGNQEGCFLKSLAAEKIEGHNSRVFAATFHPKRRFEFISGGWDDTVQFWDTRRPRSLRYFSGAHICGEGLDIDKSGEQIMTSSYQLEKPLSLWDYRTGLLTLNIDDEKNKLYCGRFINQNYLVTGSSDPCELRLVNLFTYSTVAIYKQPHLGVYCISHYLNPTSGPTKDFCVNTRIAFTSNNFCSEVEISYEFS